MSEIKTIYKGESVTLLFTLPELYDMARIESQKVFIGETEFSGVKDGQTIKLQLKSSDTDRMTGNHKVYLWFDDTVLGVRKPYCGDLIVARTQASGSNASVSNISDIIIPIVISETAITVGDVLYNYVKGDPGIQGIQGIQGIPGADAEVTATNVGTVLDGLAEDTVEDTSTFAFYKTALKKITWTNIKATLKSYFDGVYATIEAVLGKKYFHGTETIGAVTFDNTTHVVTIASIKYWYKGISFTGNNVTCDIDTYFTPLTANTLYYIYFDAASGTLKAKTVNFLLKEEVPICLIWWNGTAGAIQKEWHGYQRDIDWHINAHMTIGARYYSGLSLTLPSVVTPTNLNISAGTLYDEDLKLDIAETVNSARLVRQVSAGVYTFADISLPYAGASGTPEYVTTNGYNLSPVTNNKYANYWVYGTNDISRAIYIIPTHAATPYNTVALARAETPPALAGLNITPEIRLLYKLTYNGNGAFVEKVDYRQSSSLPAGGTSATTIAEVSGLQAELDAKENTANKQNNLTADGTGTKFPTVDAVNAGLAGNTNLLYKYVHSGNKEVYISSIDYSTNTFTSVNHGLVNGDRLGLRIISDGIIENVIPFTDAIPQTSSTTGYYVINSAGDTFQISATSGGAAITTINKATQDFSKWRFEVLIAQNILLPNIPSIGCEIEVIGDIMQLNRYVNENSYQVLSSGYNQSNVTSSSLTHSNTYLLKGWYRISIRETETSMFVNRKYVGIQLDTTNSTRIKWVTAEIIMLTNGDISLIDNILLTTVILTNGTIINVYKI